MDVVSLYKVRSLNTIYTLFLPSFRGEMNINFRDIKNKIIKKGIKYRKCKILRTGHSRWNEKRKQISHICLTYGCRAVKTELLNKQKGNMHKFLPRISIKKQKLRNDCMMYIFVTKRKCILKNCELIK